MCETELTCAIAHATRNAIRALHAEHGTEFCQYCLISTAEALRPYLCATTPHMHLGDLVEGPYALYGEEFLAPLSRIFDMRGNLHDLNNEDYDTEYELRYRCMEKALTQLDDEGLFGTGEKRKNTLIGVLIMPPDATNTARMVRLNPHNMLLDTWLNQCAEKETDT